MENDKQKEFINLAEKVADVIDDQPVAIVAVALSAHLIDLAHSLQSVNGEEKERVIEYLAGTFEKSAQIVRSDDISREVETKLG